MRTRHRVRLSEHCSLGRASRGVGECGPEAKRRDGWIAIRRDRHIPAAPWICQDHLFGVKLYLNRNAVVAVILDFLPLILCTHLADSSSHELFVMFHHGWDKSHVPILGDPKQLVIVKCMQILS